MTALRRIDNYGTDDPRKLADQLSQLEDNIQAAIDNTPAKETWSGWVSAGSPRLAYDTIARIDTATNAIAATLPSVSAATAGRRVGVKRKGANNVTLEPVESTALIDGASSVTLGADGLYIYVHDGTEWSRV